MEKSQKDQALKDALTPIITELIDNNFENSKDKIAVQISPLIGPAIREQIKAKKDDIIEALYPILGNMISKFVSKSLEDMLNTINAQIQDGLSFKAFKRKFQAKRKGISETQLLLEENSHSIIRAVLLIHKETGIVLSSKHNEQEALSEPEMIASMMTAITSFINDWIEKNQSTSEVTEIDYGSSKIVLESAGYAYLAVIIDGPRYSKTIEKIRHTLEHIILEHGDAIREFNGDLDQFSTSNIPQSISNLIEESDAPEEEKEKEKKRLHPLIFLVPMLLIFWLVWNLYENSLTQTLEKNIKETLYKTSQLTIYRIDSKIEDNTVYLSGEVPSSYHKDLAQNVLSKITDIPKIQNNLIVTHSLDDPMQISSNIAHLIKGFNTNEGTNITYTYNYPTLTLLGSTWDNTRKEKVLLTLKNSQLSKTIVDKIITVPPNSKTIFLFNAGISVLNTLQERELLELSKYLKTLDNQIIISVKGFSDHTGSLDKQEYISKKRAENVAYLLRNKFFVTQEILISTNDDISLYIDTNEDPNKQRCTIITLENREK